MTDDVARAELERRVAERLSVVFFEAEIDSSWLAVAREAIRLLELTGVDEATIAKLMETEP